MMYTIFLIFILCIIFYPAFLIFKIAHKNVIKNENTPSPLIGTLWYVPGLNNNEPILKIDSIEHNFVTCSYLDEENKNKEHYQELDEFLECFSQY